MTTPNESSSTSSSTTRTGNEVRTEQHSVTVVRDDTPRRAFKLKAGKRHFQDGFPVDAGDQVMLTQDQARAFADKFEPAEEKGEFKKGEYQAYRPRAQRDDAKKEDAKREYGKGEKDDATHGQPVATPPIVVPDPAQNAAANQLPKDITSLDPAKQGQQTDEQRAIIDRGDAPAPVVPKPQPPQDKQPPAQGQAGQPQGQSQK